jgi:hypothetical protein
MSAMSQYLEQALLNHLLRGTAMHAPAKLYVALYTSTPDNRQQEVIGGQYSRVELNCAPGVWNNPSETGLTTNSAPIVFPVASAPWGQISHVAIYDAAVEGNVLFAAALESPVQVEAGHGFSFPAGALSVRLA